MPLCDVGRRLMIKPTNEIHSEEVRRRIDGSLDFEFYHRRAVMLRAEAIERGLSVTWQVVRAWAAATARLTRRVGWPLMTTPRRPDGAPFKKGRHPWATSISQKTWT